MGKFPRYHPEGPAFLRTYRRRRSRSSFWSWERSGKVVCYLIVFGCIFGMMIIYFKPRRDVVCYPRVGCFDISGLWTERPRIFNYLPQHPSVLNTTFMISSRWWGDLNGSQFDTQILTYPFQYSHSRLNRFRWGRDDLVVFIIHGYTDHSDDWMRDLRAAFLAVGDVTVVIVDWRHGAAGYYPQVVANTRVVAREIQIFITRLIIRHFSTSGKQKRFHLVGHSLGAQIAGYVGKFMREAGWELYQITALDPAFPLFEGLSNRIRLHKTDAATVLVIHSNIGPWGLGMKEAVGTIDIYLNDGRDQRGCVRMKALIKEPLKLQLSNINTDGLQHLKDLLACSHRRAYEVLIDILYSLKGPHGTGGEYIAYPVLITGPNDAEFTSRKISFCQAKRGDCWRLTYNPGNNFFNLPTRLEASSFFGRATSYYMATADKSPYCVRFAHLEIQTCPSAPVQVESLYNRYLVTISYVVYGDEIRIYRGKVRAKQKIRAWVEFSCRSLLDMNWKKEPLSILFSIRYADLEDMNARQGPHGSSSNNTHPPNSTVTRSRKRFCWSDMQLTYYNQLRDELHTLKPCEPMTKRFKVWKNSKSDFEDNGESYNNVDERFWDLDNCFQVIFNTKEEKVMDMDIEDNTMATSGS